MIYFDNSATTGVKPPQVIGAMKTALTHLSSNPGRSGHSAALKCAMLVHSTRKNTAKLLGVNEIERVVFLNNCSHALNAAILGTFVDGGHVVTTAYEHNSVLRPLFELQRRGKISVTVLAPNALGHVNANMIERAINNKTYMVAVNNVSNVTGAISPITEIGRFCAKRGILFLVDGAQSVGYSDVNLHEQNIDMLAVAPHKGLHAAQGVGILALGNRAIVRPNIFGGTGTNSESVYQPQELPESLETGTLPTPAIAALNAAILHNNKIRLPSMIALSQLSDYILKKLSKISGVTIYTPPNTFNGVISINIRDYTSNEVCRILNDNYDIATRGGLHCAPLIHKHLNTLNRGIVRASLSYENTAAEAEQFIRAVTEISS